MEEEWKEQIFLQEEFKIGKHGRSVVARLGFPRRAGAGPEWSCSFQFAGWKEGRIRVAHGVDGLQAMFGAVAAVRKALDRAASVQSNKEPYEFLFPRFVPMSYGLEFHRHLCGILDAEIAKKEKRLSRRRLSRKGRS
jgi:hypothetical protein